MKLQELLIQIKEQNLSKDKLESLRDSMVDVFSQMKLEIAGLQKEEAMFLNGQDGTVVSKKVAWNATVSGQRLIELKRYCEALKPQIDNLKSRLYSIY